jgi:hypothetical protein
MDGEVFWVINESALNKPQAVGSDGPCGHALKLLSKLPVTQPSAAVLAQLAVDEDFE